MLLQRVATNDLFSSLQEMQLLQQRLNRMLAGGEGLSREFPPINIWASAEGAIVRAEIPGLGSDDVELSLVNDTLTIRGECQSGSKCESGTCHRQERRIGQFTRTVQLPFNIEADKVEARFFNGVLEVKLPRAEADKPRRINVQSN
jgi:HSP20 family protein